MVNVAGFENTIAVSQKLKGMVQQFGDEVLNNPDKFVALMNDYIPEYEKERRLLKNVAKSGVLIAMQRGDNQKIAMMKAKEYMINEMFLSEGAVEFVMVCFTYLLDWPYETTMPEQGAVAAPAQQFQAQPQYNNVAAAATPYSAPVSAYTPPPQVSQPAPVPQASAPMMPGTSSIAPAQPEDNPVIFYASDAARSRLKGNVKVPSGYTQLDKFCFDGFSFMKTIELPTTLITIGEYAFSECKRLKSVTIPPSVRIIAQGAFSTCGKLAMVNVPNGVTEIADQTFEFCHNLERVELPNTIISIGNQAFAGCESLKKLFISDSVKKIADDAFQNCSSLTIKCYENSYVARYCMENGIRTETVTRGGLF